MDEPFELMYRAPGETEHKNITEALDKIITRLDTLEYVLTKLLNEKATQTDE